ncbi:MAG: tyrosine-type recombinase/integrase [Bryobacterales bacterium]|nr:tyrosine-type recombinase/integrase [Bryobacterales bacterium]
MKRNPGLKPTRFLSRTEIRRLHKALDSHRGRGSGRQQADIIRLLLLTGCRRGELVNLRWAEVQGDVLRLRDAKSGPRTVFLNAPARALLGRQPRTESDYVFPSREDPARCRSTELSLWRKIRKQARLEDVRLHDLRHTFASYAVMRGVPLPVVSRLLGHSNTRMTLRYAHVSDRATEAAAERIGTTIAGLLTGTPTRPARRPGRTTDIPIARPLTAPRSEPDFATLTPSDTNRTLSGVVEMVTTSELRQSVRKVLDRIENHGPPVVICRRRAPAAVLVNLADYHERYVQREGG